MSKPYERTTRPCFRCNVSRIPADLPAGVVVCDPCIDLALEREAKAKERRVFAEPPEPIPVAKRAIDGEDRRFMRTRRPPLLDREIPGMPDPITGRAYHRSREPYLDVARLDPAAHARPVVRGHLGPLGPRAARS